jgi:hypothetical protein
MNAIVDSHELNFMMLAVLDDRNGGSMENESCFCNVWGRRALTDAKTLDLLQPTEHR